MDNQELRQRLRDLRQAQAHYQKQLVDPVAELILASASLERVHARVPVDIDTAQMMMNNIIYLRRVIRDLTLALAEVKPQIQQTEAELTRQQPHTSCSPSASDEKTNLPR